MYVNGLNPKIQALSPSVTFPVGRGTPSINSLPLWDHSQQWTPVVTLSSKVIIILRNIVKFVQKLKFML